MTRRIGRPVLAFLTTSAIAYALTRGSALGVRQQDAGISRLRLSWSARPERIEVCHALSAEEQAEREEHMRQRVECDGRFATYLLQVQSDGRTVHESVARGAGLRHDRPLYLLHEVDVEPGMHRLQVSFSRREKTDNDATAFAGVTAPASDTGLFAGRSQREAVERARRARAAIPPRLVLDTTVDFVRGRVIVVSLDPERQRLQLLADARR